MQHFQRFLYMFCIEELHFLILFDRKLGENYFLDNFKSLPNDWLLQEKYESKHRIICDYISGMTDRYASKLYKSIYE